MRRRDPADLGVVATAGVALRRAIDQPTRCTALGLTHRTNSLLDRVVEQGLRRCSLRVPQTHNIDDSFVSIALRQDGMRFGTSHQASLNSLNVAAYASERGSRSKSGNGSSNILAP